MSKFPRIAFSMLVASMAASVAIARDAPSTPAYTPPSAEQKQKAYADIAKLPDWSGAWLADSAPLVLQTNDAIPLKPAYAAKLAKLRAEVKASGKLPGNPECKPIGMPLYMEMQGPLVEFLFAPGRVFMTAENQEIRVIFTDGRPVPKEVALDYSNGTSVGHWEGDTLVVDTIGLLPETEIFPEIENGSGLHIKERIHLAGPNKLQDDITLTSDAAFTKPYSYSRTFTRHPEWNVSEFVCQTQSHADYQMASGYNPTPAQLITSTDQKPPVRLKNEPGTNGASLPGATWASIAQLPEWFGPWAYEGNQGPEVTGTELIPLTPSWQKRVDESRAINKRGGDVPSDVYHCRPRGAAQMMKAAGGNFDVVYTPGRVTFVSETGQTRRIYTDGRGHPANLELSFNGHSIGHWEGETLVIDTVGLRPDIQMMYGVPAGDGLHMVEHYHIIEPTKIKIDTTQTSPVALTEPWNYWRTFTRHQDWNLMEQYCTQNNRDVHPESGMQQFDLTPPPEAGP